MPRPYAPLGTTEWRSYAYFRRAVELENSDRVAARTMYEQACGVDPRNRGATLNLATLDLTDLHFYRAIRGFKDVRALAADDQPNYMRHSRRGEWRWHWAQSAEWDDKRAARQKENRSTGKRKDWGYFSDPIWYKASFQLAATYDYLAMLPSHAREAILGLDTVDPATNQETDEELMICLQETDEEKKSTCLSSTAASYSRTLVHSLKYTICIAENVWRRDQIEKNLLEFLRSFENISQILYAGTLIGADQLDDAHKIIKVIEDGRPKVPPLDQPDAVRRWYEEQYELACYYARKAVRQQTGFSREGTREDSECLDTAFKRLSAISSRSPAGARLLKQAPRDISFTSVQDESFLAKIRKFVQSTLDTSNGSQQVYALEKIAGNNADKLRRIGIVSPSDLILYLDDEEQQELKDRIPGNVGPQQITDWVNLAHVAVVIRDDAQLRYTAYLDDKSIISVQKLACSAPKDLVGANEEVAVSLAQAEDWRRRAKIELAFQERAVTSGGSPSP
jgi:hypothetical protein